MSSPCQSTATVQAAFIPVATRERYQSKRGAGSAGVADRAADAVGQELAGLGAGTVFGVVGSGNFHVTNALIAGGARFIAARHEGGAAVMADAWARTMGKPGAAGAVGVLSVHQGPGLTNAMTGIAEAAKSRMPLLVLAAEVPEIRSNFHVDVAGWVPPGGGVLGGRPPGQYSRSRAGHPWRDARTRVRFTLRPHAAQV